MPTIGVGTFVVTMQNGVLKFLLGLRSKENKRGPGIWALPGGMLDPGEGIDECTIREVKEETDLDVDVDPPEDHRDEFMDCVVGVSHHYPREDHITVWTVAFCTEGEPKVMEPTKCQEWRWVTVEEFLELTPQVGEQVHWAPHRVMRIILPRIGFPAF